MTPDLKKRLEQIQADPSFGQILAEQRADYLQRHPAPPTPIASKRPKRKRS